MNLRLVRWTVEGTDVDHVACVRWQVQKSDSDASRRVLLEHDNLTTFEETIRDCSLNVSALCLQNDSTVRLTEVTSKGLVNSSAMVC